MGCLNTKPKSDDIPHDVSHEQYVNRVLGNVGINNSAIVKKSIYGNEVQKYEEEKKNYVGLADVPRAIDKDSVEFKMLAAVQTSELEQYDYKYALVTDVYDGDTYTIQVAQKNLNHGIKYSVRLYGADTPEVRGENKEMGIRVRDYVRELILGKYVQIRILNNKKIGKRVIKEKYGRMLAFVFFENDRGLLQDLAEHLISIGYAVPYFGGKKD